MFQRIKCRWFNRHHAAWYVTLSGDEQILACMHCKLILLRRGIKRVPDQGMYQGHEDTPVYQPPKPTVH
jgi:hypothetical protein